MVSYFDAKGEFVAFVTPNVLILVVVDNGLVPNKMGAVSTYKEVLILVVVDNGLVPTADKSINFLK